MDNPLDFFIHVPKTAGTTMQSIIDRQYPPHSMMRVHHVPADELPGRLENIGPEIAIVAGGHLHFGYSRYFPRPFRAFTLLREPVARVISLYHYIARKKSHRMHRAFLAGQVSIAGLATEQASYQARFIAGCGANEKVEDEVVLARARENLEEKITGFGLTERFDESLLLFTQALGWKVRGYARENVTRSRPAQQAISPADLEIIRSASALDLALYEFARELFEQRIAAQPPDFARQLAALRRNVKMAQRVRRVREGLGSLARKLWLGK